MDNNGFVIAALVVGFIVFATLKGDLRGYLQVVGVVN